MLGRRVRALGPDMGRLPRDVAALIWHMLPSHSKTFLRSICLPSERRVKSEDVIESIIESHEDDLIELHLPAFRGRSEWRERLLAAAVRSGDVLLFKHVKRTIRYSRVNKIMTDALAHHVIQLRDDGAYHAMFAELKCDVIRDSVARYLLWRRAPRRVQRFFALNLPGWLAIKIALLAHDFDVLEHGLRYGFWIWSTFLRPELVTNTVVSGHGWDCRSFFTWIRRSHPDFQWNMDVRDDLVRYTQVEGCIQWLDKEGAFKA